MTIGVLITNYNSWPMARRNLAAHLQHAGAGIDQLVLVDDASTDACGEPIDPRVRVIRNQENLGFVRAVNVGLRHIATDIVVLFDADAVPLMDYTAVLRREFAADPQLGVMGFTTYDEQHAISGSCEREPGVASLVLGQKLYAFYQRWQPITPDNVVVYSCAMALRRRALDDVGGGFDEAFDWLDPDHDLCMSLRRQGWTIKRSPELSAMHEGGGTPQRTSARVLRFYKNRWYLLRKHGRIRNAAIPRLLVLARLRAEFLLLRLCGRWLFPDGGVLQDKLEGRRRIITFCQQHYH